MVVLPLATAVARPPLVMVATAGFEELQVTVPNACRLPSLKTPVAVNCSLPPWGMLALAGPTAIELKTAAVTVRVELPLTEPDVAVMVELPLLTPVTKPLALTVATEVDDELQLTELNVCVLPSLKLPLAVNCWVSPAGMLLLTGLTAIDCSVPRPPYPLDPPPPPHPA